MTAAGGLVGHGAPVTAAVVAFTDSGAALALRVAGLLGADAWAPEGRCLPGMQPLSEPIAAWAGRRFADRDALVFVGACGIAVRAIAPHLRSKTVDPAVLVVDEAGRHVVPLVGGHIGGANELAVRLAAWLDAEPVLTTATDLNGLPAVDTWAVRHGCAIENPAAIKQVAARTLAGHPVGVAVTEQLLDPPFPVTLWLRPRQLVLGVGCRRQVDASMLEEAVRDFLRGAGVSILSLAAVASIDLKAREPAILALCARHGLPFDTHTAEELAAVPGRFTASERVLAHTGVDNVCERAAVRTAGNGVLLRGKTLYPGITLALARREAADGDPHGGH